MGEICVMFAHSRWWNCLKKICCGIPKTEISKSNEIHLWWYRLCTISVHEIAYRNAQWKSHRNCMMKTMQTRWKNDERIHKVRWILLEISSFSGYMCRDIVCIIASRMQSERLLLTLIQILSTATVMTRASNKVTKAVIVIYHMFSIRFFICCCCCWFLCLCLFLFWGAFALFLCAFYFLHFLWKILLSWITVSVLHGYLPVGKV